MIQSVQIFLVLLFLARCTATPETSQPEYESQTDYRSGKPATESEDNK